MKASPYQISAFTHAAREGSFSRAATVLGVTQSSITQHVAKLERIMGAQLFIRRRDGLELTRAGRDLYSVSDRLSTLEQLIEEKVRSYSTLTGGHLTLIATAPRPVMPIISRYSALYPQVQIEFSLKSWTQSMELVRDRQVDIALFPEPTASDGLYIRDFAETRYLAFLRHDHALAKRPRVSLRDLAKETIVLPEDGSLTQKIVNEKCRALDVQLLRVIKTTTFPVVKEAVLHGIGVGLFLEDSLFPSRNLVAIPVDEMPETYRNCLVTPADKADLRLVQSFVDVAFEREVKAGAS